MFHTPAMNMVEMQAEAMGLPILISETEGEKEKELADLEKAIKEAKEKYGLTQIVAGALYSKYQYDRVVKICDSLDLEALAPLWHMSQETLLRELIAESFDVRITRIASQGLDESFLGKKIDESVVKKFAAINKKMGFHMAGEGGEYESLVVDCPMFKKRVVIDDSKKVMQSDITGALEITKAHLEEK